MNLRLLAFGLFLTLAACSPQNSFQNDPFCASCIASACQNGDANHAFQNYFNAQNPQIQAQLVAVMEAADGCMTGLSWAKTAADQAYQHAAAAFYAPSQPAIQTRILRAFDDIQQNSDRKNLALRYLENHVDTWKSAPWAQDSLNKLQNIADDNAVFSILARTASNQALTKLSEMELTPEHIQALIFRWPELNDDVRKNVLANWISFGWVMQSSGSSQLPQYLVLNWAKRPLPTGAPAFYMSVVPTSVKIQNKVAKKGDFIASNALKMPPLLEPGTRHARVDLQPWLTSADNYRVAASATLNIWPEGTSTECLEMQESCTDTPIISEEFSIDRQYRVFLGMETGAPNRVKNDAQNAETSKAIQLELCNAEVCLPLWADGAKTGGRKTPLRVVQGEDFYLKTTANHASHPIAMRLMARAGAGKAWREIATATGFAPTVWNAPIRSDIQLEELCGKTGKCSLELQVRPSLRMARRDPRFSSYWGATLELGAVVLDIQNLTPAQMASE